jgi:hypothetical protein
MAKEDTTKESTKVDTKSTEVPAPTAEQIEQAAQSNIDALFGDFEAGKKEEKPAEQKPAAAPEAPAAPAGEKTEENPAEKPAAAAPAQPEAKPEATTLSGLEDESGAPPEKKPAPARRPADVLDDETIDDVANRIAERIKPAETKKEDKPAISLDGLDAQEKRQIEGLTFLSKNDPRFKGRDLAAETIKFWRAEEDYKRRWEESHHGEAFDPEDPAHAAFYRKNEPAGVAVEDIDEALIEKRVQERTAESERRTTAKSREEIDKRLKPIERAKLESERAPAIRASINAAVEEMAKEVVPDLLGEEGLTRSTLEKLKTEDPAALELLDTESAILNVRIRELERIRHLPDHFELDLNMEVKVNDERVTPHYDIVATSIELEDRIAALPADDQVHDGRRFISRRERDDRIKLINASALDNAQKEARINRLLDATWVVDIDDIRAAMVKKSAARVKKYLGIARKASAGRNGESGKTQQSTQQLKPADTSSSSGKGAPAAVAAESDIVHTRIPGTPAGKSQAEINSQGLFP